MLKFRFSEKATKYEKISHFVFIHLISGVKEIGKFIQIFVVFSENLKFLYESAPFGLEII